MSLTPHHSLDVTVGVQLRLVVADADAVPLNVSLRYQAADPYAVRAIFGSADLEVEWVFARALLSSGLERPCGEGDVRVWPGAPTRRGDTVRLSLTSPDGHAVLEGEAADLREFLDATYDAVPPGSESDHVDMDQALQHILA